MSILRGSIRLTLALTTLAVGCILIVLATFIPGKIGPYRPVFWVLQGVARLVLATLNIRAHSPNAAALRQHEGFFFPNHVSYIDILVLLAIAPSRFLAKAEVRQMPILGLAAQAIGCYFVQRKDKQSRQQARAQLAANQNLFPAVTIFPEGRRSANSDLLPFRYGAFDIAIQGGVPILPCLITYSRPDLIMWPHQLNSIRGLWQVAAYAHQPIRATVTPLPVVAPRPEDEAEQLAKAVHARMTAVYRTLWIEPPSIQTAVA